MPMSPKLRSITALLPAALLAAFAAAAGAVDLRPAPPLGEMAVVYAPWVGEADAMAAVVAAGGRVAASSRLTNIVIAYAPDAGFAERAKDGKEDQRGDHAILDGGCPGLVAAKSLQGQMKSRRKATSGASAGGIGYSASFWGFTHARASCSRAVTNPSQRLHRYNGMSR